MTVFNSDFSKVMIRFYIMMAVIIAAGFSGMWYLGLLGLPIFLSAILGIKPETKLDTDAKIVPIATDQKDIAA